MKACLLLVIVAVVASLGLAQSDPIKVGEYQSSAVDRKRVGREIDGFLAQLAKEPKSTRGAIAFINGFKFKGPCIGNRLVGDRSLEKAIRASIPRKFSNRIVFIPSEQWSLLPEIQFYIIPPGATLPGKIERIVDPPCCCSEMRIDGPFEVARSGVQRVRYSLHLPLESKRKPSKPIWTLSTGRIVVGQGTKSIIVELSDSTAESITVEVSVTSPNPTCGCPTVASFETRISKRER